MSSQENEENQKFEQKIKSKMQSSQYDYDQIIKYSDLSKKWGVGYMFKSKSIGVYFNDKTQLLRHKES